MQTHSYKDLLGAAEVKELIFKYQESLMCYYMGLSVTEEKVSSPLREDTTANCNFYYSDTGTLRFMD